MMMTMTYLVKEAIAVRVTKRAGLFASRVLDNNVGSKRRSGAGRSCNPFEKHHLCDQKKMNC